MSAAIVAGVVGFVLGVGLAASLAVTRRQRSRCPDSEAHNLDATDHQAISNEFATHAAAVRRELSHYADELADGDGALRERLRVFEGQE